MFACLCLCVCMLFILYKWLDFHFYFIILIVNMRKVFNAPNLAEAKERAIDLLLQQKFHQRPRKCCHVGLFYGLLLDHIAFHSSSMEEVRNLISIYWNVYGMSCRDRMLTPANSEDDDDDSGYASCV